MTCPFPRRSHSPSAQAGFLLPLSIGTSLLLLLGSLSLQLAVLQGRILMGAQRDRQQAEDAVHSAAHQISGALLGPFRCLLAVPSSTWLADALPAECPEGLDPQPLLHTTVAGRRVELHSWTPGSDGGELQLQLQDGRHSTRFRLRLSPAVTLKELG